MRDLLTEAREQIRRTQSPIREAALLRLARVESIADPGKARITLELAIEEARALAPRTRDAVFGLARNIAAAIAPDLLPVVPVTGPPGFADSMTVKVMLDHGRVDDAFNYLMQSDPPNRSFNYVGNVLGALPDGEPKLALLRRSIEVWRSGAGDVVIGHMRPFMWHLKLLPPEEGKVIVHEVVASVLAESDRPADVTFDEGRVRLTTHRQYQFFQMMHAIRHFDEDLAQHLLAENPELAAAIHRYPLGAVTQHEEALEMVKKLPPDRPRGYILGGDPRDRDYQMSLLDATRTGDFEPALQHALEKYAEDTAGHDPNAAPKPFWPSGAAFRTILFRAGKQLGEPAATYLTRIPDPDLRLLAKIELAAGLAGLPELPGIQIKAPSPNGLKRRIRRSRRPEENEKILGTKGETVRCPECLIYPTKDDRWGCKCRHIWNTFETRGLCPGCGHQWQVTMCLNCHQLSPHKDWYVKE